MQNTSHRSTNLSNSHAYEARLNRIHRIFKTHYNVTEPSIIMEPYLFLGNCISAHDVNRLNRLGIRYILNVAIRDVELCPYYSRDMRTLTIDLRDDDRENILRTFDQAFAFIDEARRAKSRVLVHCSHGQSRSPAIVIAYLMRSYHISLEQCLMHVVKARPCVIPNDGFLKQLILYDRFLVERRRQQKQQELERQQIAAQAKAEALKTKNGSTGEQAEIPIQHQTTEKSLENNETTDSVSEVTTSSLSSKSESDQSQLTSVDSSSVTVTSTKSNHSSSSAESVHVIPIQMARTKKNEGKQKRSTTTSTNNQLEKSTEKSQEKEIFMQTDKSGQEIIFTKESKRSNSSKKVNIENSSMVNNYVIQSEQYSIESSLLVPSHQWNLINYYPNGSFESNAQQAQTKYITEVYDRATNRFIPTTCCY